MKTSRKITAAIVAGAATLALALAACSSGAAGTSTPTPAASSPPVSTVPANPVALVRQAGATPTPGERYGTTTAVGLSADGTLPGGERITLYTLPADGDGAQAAAKAGATSSDSQVVITGPDFYAFVYPAQNQDTGATSWPVAPTTIAAHLHGTVQAPADAS
jgi:hypothetical protein